MRANVHRTPPWHENSVDLKNVRPRRSPLSGHFSVGRPSGEGRPSQQSGPRRDIRRPTFLSFLSDFTLSNSPETDTIPSPGKPEEPSKLRAFRSGSESLVTEYQ